MKLSELLKKENNNLDIFRLLAACMVVYGHSYAIAPQLGETDFVGRLLGYDYSGSLAVKIFFFLSGLVVTNSLLQTRSISKFVISRFFRIWPGLITVVVITSLVLVPLVTELPMREYFARGETYRYIFDNVLLRLAYNLPGAFLHSPYGAVNGSLWTLPLEVGIYLGLLAFFMVGVFRSPVLALTLCLLILVDPLTGNKLLFTWRMPNMHTDLLAPCFAIGAMLALLKERIEVGLSVVSGLILMFLLFRSSSYSFYFLYAALFSVILYLSGLPVLLKLKMRSDPSYGVYLWGFPLQQILQHFTPGQGTQFNQVVSLMITLAFGFASWHLVEKKGVALGKMLIERINASNTAKEKSQAIPPET